MEHSVFVNPKSCSCRNPKKACRRAVLESSKKPFVVQRLSADHEEEQGLFSWDLAMFRYPRRPEFKQVKTIEKMKYLDLEFATVAGRTPLLICSLTFGRQIPALAPYLLRLLSAIWSFVSTLP